MVTNVVKRDGSVVSYDKDKIFTAIMKAMKNGSGIVNEEVATHIANSCEFNFDGEVTISQIEDYIFDELIRLGEYKTARCYSEFKAMRTCKRNQDSQLFRKLKTIVECKDIKNANANVDEWSFGGRKFESAGLLHKELALQQLSDDVSTAHLNNLVYQHDLDSHSTGMHNCLNANLPKLLANGFKTRNGDCRPAGSVNTAMQLTAVIFQIQSQDQFGGVGSIHYDYDIAPYVKKSFVKYLRKTLKRSGLSLELCEEIMMHDELIRPDDKYKTELINRIGKLNDDFRNYKLFNSAWEDAMEDLDDEGKQSTQALYHNLNTLESRPGSQVPFTSINFGRDTSCEGRMVSKWILNASLDGIGKFHRTSIFPISIFQYKKGVNDKEGTPNYDLFKLVMKSISRRIYPNIVNCDWSQNVEDENDPDTFLATMGK